MCSPLSNMNLAASLRPHVASPVSAFTDLPDIFRGYVDDASLDDGEEANAPELAGGIRSGSASLSSLRALLSFFWRPPVWTNWGRVSTSSPSSKTAAFEDGQPLSQQTLPWQIDGSAARGICFYGVPIGQVANLKPTRVDIWIVDQTKWPVALRKPLDAAKSAHCQDSRGARLGIGKHLARALTEWSSNINDFEMQYRGLPFGSTINVHNIASDLAAMRIDMEPNTSWPEVALSFEALRQMWMFPEATYPRVVSTDQLRFVKQIGASVTLVNFADNPNGEAVVFKSRIDAVAGLYHEIKMLLTIPEHLNIIRRPSHLVTTRCAGGEQKVCGFLLPYYSGNTLLEALPQRLNSGTLKFEDQIRWAKELAKVLVHIRASGQFYSDLKTDNVLLQSVNSGDSVVLLDFENNRNIFAWAPPEIYYIDWLSELARSSMLAKDLQEKYKQLLRTYLVARGVIWPIRTAGGVYDNPTHGYYFPWLASTRREQEAGEVYCLGKIMWCIFEGVGEISNVLGRSHAHEVDQEFPDFRLTPKPLRALIERCTAGSREWSGSRLGVYRHGSRVYPRGKSGRNGEPKGTVAETEAAIKQTWRTEVENIEAFVEARLRHDNGEARAEDFAYLGYLERPSLQEVIQELDKISVM